MVFATDDATSAALVRLDMSQITNDAACTIQAKLLVLHTPNACPERQVGFRL